MNEICLNILNSIRCVFGISHDHPIIEEEWGGDSFCTGGVKDYIISLFRKEKKKAYIAGYVAGAKGSYEALILENKDLVFSIEDAEIGAERNFLEWEKE